jgi:hypothetical protein
MILVTCKNDGFKEFKFPNIEQLTGAHKVITQLDGNFNYYFDKGYFHLLDPHDSLEEGEFYLIAKINGQYWDFSFLSKEEREGGKKIFKELYKITAQEF